MIITVTCLSVVDNLITLRVSPQQVYSNCIIQIAEYNIYNTMIKSWTNVTTLTSLNQIIEYTFTLIPYTNAVVNASKIGVRLITTDCLGGSESGCIECVSDSYILDVCEIGSGSGGSGEGCASGSGLCPVLTDNISIGELKGYGLLTGYSAQNCVFSKIINEPDAWEAIAEMTSNDHAGCKINVYCKIRCENGHLVETGNSLVSIGSSPSSNLDWRFIGPAYWPDYQANILKTINEIPQTFDSFLVTASSFPGQSAFMGGVLLPDGRVFCVPYQSTTARIFNLTTNEVTTPAGTYPGNTAFRGGVLLKDGRVFCVPSNTTQARIYDPVSNTLTIPSGTYSGSNVFTGGVLLPDGRVFLVPGSSATARIYDPVSDTVTTPSGTYPGGIAYMGGVLLPDGRVFCVPYTATQARIYDPVSNTTTIAAGTYPGGNPFNGGVLLPDGRVFCVPYTSTSARIYNPITNTLTIPSGTYPGDPAGSFVGGALLNTGNVFMCPRQGGPAYIYNPTTDSLRQSSVTLPPGLGNGLVMMNGGHIFTVPSTATTAWLFREWWSPFFDINVCLSAYYNKI